MTVTRYTVQPRKHGPYMVPAVIKLTFSGQRASDGLYTADNGQLVRDLDGPGLYASRALAEDERARIIRGLPS